MESRYYVSLKKSDEGYSVWVPGLPGCASQGTNEKEALENIQDAIQEYLAVAESLTEAGEKREVVVSR
jgi:predicted RNase H-like HicB family nuclease